MEYLKKYLKYKKKYLMYSNKFNLLKGGADKDGAKKLTLRFLKGFTEEFKEIEIFSPPTTTKPFTEFIEKFNEVLLGFEYVQLPLESSIQSDMKICIRGVLQDSKGVLPDSKGDLPDSKGVLPDSKVIFIEYFFLNIFFEKIFNIENFKTKYSITGDNIEIRLIATNIVDLLLWALDEHMELYKSSKQGTSFLSKKLSRLIPKKTLTLTARDTLVIILKLLDIFKSKPDKDLSELFNILFYIDKYLKPLNSLLEEDIDIQELLSLFSSSLLEKDIDSTISTTDIYGQYILLLRKVYRLIPQFYNRQPQGNIEEFTFSIKKILLEQGEIIN